MPRLHALELVPDDAGDLAVRRDWQVLRKAGLPSQLDHPGATNSPHVTVLALPELTAETEQRAAGLLVPLLPVTVRASGLAVLGGARVTLARLLDAPEALTRAVLDLRAGHEDERHPSWLPHVTLARRMPRSEVQRAVEVLGYDDVQLTLASLRRWDPERREVRHLWTHGIGIGTGGGHTGPVRTAYAHDALLDPEPALDHRAPGGAVTLALCGSLEHEPPCPLAPHHTTVEVEGDLLRVRVLFAVESANEPRVRALVEGALAGGTWTYPDGVVSTWTLVSSRPDAVAASEREHADRLIDA
jgi:hypothetical protein